MLVAGAETAGFKAATVAIFATVIEATAGLYSTA